MFFVFNKEKIYSYIIAVATVAILFGVSILYQEDESTVEVSTNIANEIENSNVINNNL